DQHIRTGRVEPQRIVRIADGQDSSAALVGTTRRDDHRPADRDIPGVERLIRRPIEPDRKRPRAARRLVIELGLRGREPLSGGNGVARGDKMALGREGVGGGGRWGGWRGGGRPVRLEVCREKWGAGGGGALGVGGRDGLWPGLVWCDRDRARREVAAGRAPRG